MRSVASNGMPAVDRSLARRAAVVVAVAAAGLLIVGIVLVIAHANSSSGAALPPQPAYTPADPAASAGALPTLPATPASRPAPTAPSNSNAATRLATFWGIDVSWPQCDPGALPNITTGFVTVGVNDGKPFTANPCLPAQAAYAKTHSGYSAYLNIDAPRGGNPASYGARVARDGLARVRSVGLGSPVIWLDVETLNHWSSDLTANVAVINGALHALQRQHVTAGIYSSADMWQRITGGATVQVPVWLATSVTDYRTVDPLCQAGLGGEAAVLAQYVATTGTQLIDVDVLCTATRSQSVGMFAAGPGGR